MGRHISLISPRQKISRELLLGGVCSVRPLNSSSTLCLPLAAVAADPLKMLLRPPSLCRLRTTDTGPEYFLGPPALDWTCKQYEVSIRGQYVDYFRSNNVLSVCQAGDCA